MAEAPPLPYKHPDQSLIPPAPRAPPPPPPRASSLGGRADLAADRGNASSHHTGAEGGNGRVGAGSGRTCGLLPSSTCLPLSSALCRAALSLCSALSLVLKQAATAASSLAERILSLTSPLSVLVVPWCEVIIAS